ncbi:uncharacterized protein BXZ73DRAFT_95817 [Epithele typhae]|uniref:uncharacterized protein n=1 Tax=Epithele typhae TaxID=378194 RepID=UPI002007343A|nr:uncharacterized protein BXZ73DRAFT_95817 [Epithele typhae]KAH9946314.1 hypothetical protein BXZ73DRAFT_95817 [Epithele typhae]
MMRSLKLYEHPEFKTEDEDISLLTTILFVSALVLLAAIFILSILCLVRWDECSTTYSVYSAQPQFMTVRQILSSTRRSI